MVKFGHILIRDLDFDKFKYPGTVENLNPSIVTIGTVKTVKTFFFAFPARNSTTMNKKLKYSISYPIIQDFQVDPLKLKRFEIFDFLSELKGRQIQIKEKSLIFRYFRLGSI